VTRGALAFRTRRIYTLSRMMRRSGAGVQWIAVGCVGLSLAGCAGRTLFKPARVTYDEATFAAKELVAYSLPAPTKDGRLAESVIGRVRTHRIRDGETLLDIARYHDLGYNEIVEANPGVDPWLPPVGEKIVLPTAWIVPCCIFEGVVLNIPEMRLYYYRPDPRDPERILVRTHPVGIGRDERRTPRGRFTVWQKTENPTWVIPDSIRADRIREHGDERRSIPGGDPENPLGQYRLKLSNSRYALHGTNQPWGVGRQVSYGCARLYPEDMHRLYPLIDIGTPVEFVYQPAKIGARGGAVYVEMHPDIYGLGLPNEKVLLAAINGRKLGAEVERTLVEASFETSRGMPVSVTSTSGAARAVTPVAPGTPPPAPTAHARAEGAVEPHRQTQRAGSEKPRRIVRFVKESASAPSALPAQAGN
jgi:L,D-transpeptidase ErfK/SrfK